MISAKIYYKIYNTELLPIVKYLKTNVTTKKIIKMRSQY